MYKKNNFIYVHFQKTAGTHVKKLLIEVFGEDKKSKWHGSLKKEDKGKLIFCGVRNPWDFYVSLFHHSKEQNSPPIAFFKAQPELYSKTYGSSDTVEGFRQWLKIILTGDVMDRNSLLLPTRFIKEGNKSVLWINKLDRLINQKPWKDVGMMSRWLFDVVVPSYRTMRIPNAKTFKEKFISESFVDHYYRIEYLTEDMRSIMEDHLSPPLGWEKVFEDWAGKKSNTTTRLKSYQAYYNDELATLVDEKDFLIIEKFGYEF